MFSNAVSAQAKVEKAAESSLDIPILVQGTGAELPQQIRQTEILQLEFQDLLA
jgi:hypothetical protein